MPPELSGSEHEIKRPHCPSPSSDGVHSVEPPLANFKDCSMVIDFQARKPDCPKKIIMVYVIAFIRRQMCRQ